MGAGMNDDVVFYHNPMSRGRIVHWMLEESGAPYRIELINFERGEQKQPAFLAVNPMGKLPAIRHRGVVVTETGAICTYLADAFASAGLAPRLEDPARGTYLRWMFFGAGCVDAAMIDRMLARPAPERTSALGYGRFDDVLATLEQAMTPGPYILGERFSAADVFIGGQIGFGLMTKVLEPRPAFQSYVGRVTQRPAYQRCLQQSERLMAQLKQAV